MGTIQRLKDEVGHLQSVLAEKNVTIQEQAGQIRALTAQRDEARERLEQANSPEQTAPDRAETS